MSVVFKDFGTAYLAAPLAVGGLTITVDKPAALPILTNGDYFYLVLQKYADRSYVEIVKVTATAGSTFTIQRGQAGTSIRAFAVGDYAELRLTVDGLTEFISQNTATKMDKSGGGDFNGLYRFLGASVGRIDVVRSSDSVVSSIVVEFSASEGHRTIVGGVTGSNVVTPSLLLRPNGYGNGSGQVKIDSSGLVDVVGLNIRGAQGADPSSAVRLDHLSNFVPTSRKINGHALTSDFGITADEVFSSGAIVNQRAVFQASDFQYKQADGAYGVRFAVSSAIAYLQGGKTDNALDDQKLYLSGWLGNPLSAFKIYADSFLIHRKSGVDYKIFDESNKPAIADVTGLSDALLQAAGLATQVADVQSRVSALETWPQRGSNSNGEWVKFKDGTMICRLNVPNANCPVADPYGSLFTGNYLWTFPQSFIEPPTVPAPSMRIGTAASWGGLSTQTYSTHATLRIIDVYRNTEANKTHISAIAIGRWK